MKHQKGTVGIENYSGRIRLRWSYSGKRYCLALGLPFSKVSLKAAQQKATQIELDVASGNFDDSLIKYGGVPKTYRPSRTHPLIVPSLFEAYMAYKGKTVLNKTLDNYRGTLKGLVQFFGRDKHTVSPAEAEKFVKWYNTQPLIPRVCRERVGLLKAAWDWAMGEGLTDSNPWVGLSLRVKVPPKQMPKPFTKEEIGAIIQAFRTDPYYSHYSDFVEFLFGTGCRTGEAIGLRWKHLSDDCSSMWIGEALTRGVRQATKTNKARTVTLTARLQQLLLSRRPTNPDPGGGLVFTALEGGPIDDNNFRGRAWTTILNRIGIPYRKPYTTRHTLISHALEQGMNPVMVAQLTGHDVQTLYQNYAGCVVSRPRLPELM